MYTLYICGKRFEADSIEEANCYLSKLVSFVEKELRFSAFDENGLEMSLDISLKSGGMC